MWPAEVRERIRADHADLRLRIEQVGPLLEELGRGSPLTLDAAKRIHSLVERVREHMRLEEEILVPALAETPGFGNVRVAELTSHHEEERATIQRILTRLAADDEDSPAVALELARWLQELCEESEEEDQRLLTRKVLDDDVIQVESGS